LTVGRNPLSPVWSGSSAVTEPANIGCVLQRQGAVVILVSSAVLAVHWPGLSEIHPHPTPEKVIYTLG
jgi:hypothetical protein